ncbi:uncharacterized protein [Nicotiana sylvestris]|uniref:uncharacterized protein isoform X1 n=1 Tax=Nicotiana sylvestris TaxID=4096 RepID=UPI00388C7920
MDMHAEVQYESDFRDAYLDDETENVTDIGKESIDGVEVEDVGECQDQKNPNETGVTEKICKCGLQSQEDLESPLGTSVSEIVCKCLEGTYDLSTPLSYKEKFGVQTCANQESFEAAREEAGVEYQEKSGVQSQDVENTEGTSRKSCELATEEHGEQLQDKENVQLEDKENDASNMLAELSVEKTQEGSVKKTDDAKLLKKFIVRLGKKKRRGRKTEGQTNIYADNNGVRKNPYKLYHQKISSKMFFLELSDSSFVLDDKHIDIALYYLRKKE